MRPGEYLIQKSPVLVFAGGRARPSRGRRCEDPFHVGQIQRDICGAGDSIAVPEIANT
jgi:hypothetical protein